MRASIWFGFLLSILVGPQLNATAKQYICHSDLCPRLEFASDLVLAQGEGGAWKAKLTLHDDNQEVFRTVGNYEGHETRSPASCVVDLRWQTGVTSHSNRATPYSLKLLNPERTFEEYKTITLEIINSYRQSKPNVCTFYCD